MPLPRLRLALIQQVHSGVNLSRCLQAQRAARGLQDSHHDALRTYQHLTPLLATHLKPPAAAVLAMRLHASVAHIEAHAHACADTHGRWLRKLPATLGVSMLVRPRAATSSPSARACVCREVRAQIAALTVRNARRDGSRRRPVHARAPVRGVACAQSLAALRL